MTRNLIRKTWITLAGTLVILVGVALLVLPGPGLVVIAAGLAILASEFEWAQRLVEPLKRKLKETTTKLRQAGKPPNDDE